jgi:hypothetical protein
MIHDFICHAVRQEFQGVAGVKWSEKRRFFELYVENAKHAVSIRFKKLDRHNRPANIPTHQQLAYVRQLPLPIDDLPAVITRLTAGYRLDTFAASMQELLMIYQSGSSLVWSFGFEGTQVDVTPLVAAPPEPATGPKVRAKNIAREERKTGGE